MENICSICRDSLFSVNTDVSVIQCGHLFHKTCLENWMITSPTCPNCKTGITAIIRKTFPDVDDGLFYNSTSNETGSFLQRIYDCDKDKRSTILKIVKRLDKQNSKLKQTYKTNLNNIETCKVFIKSFLNKNKHWEEKSRKLQTENSILKTELKKLNISTELNSVSEDPQWEHRKQIKNMSSKDSCFNTETLLSKSLLIYFYFIFRVFSKVY